MVELVQIFSPSEITPALREKFIKLSLNDMGYMSEALDMFMHYKTPCKIVYLKVSDEIVSWGIYLFEKLDCFEDRNLFCYTHKLHRHKGYGAMVIDRLNVSNTVCNVDTSTDKKASFWDSVLK